MWRRGLERARSHRERGIHDPGLERDRWLVEQFRGSVFAQHLGTAERVSIGRLDAQWRRVVA